MVTVVHLIDNDSEYSRSIERPDGMRLDICAFRDDKQLVIAVVNEDEVHVEEIAFSLEELEVLKQHLADTETQKILGGK